MNIGIVGYPTFGGSGVVATELAKALAYKGHKIHFVSYSLPFRLEPVASNIVYHEVAVSDYPLFDYPPYELVLASKLVDVARYEKLDLVHVHYAIPHASAAYMARQILLSHGIYLPVITTLHGTDITLVGRDSSFEPVITFAINESDAVTAVSESLRQETYRHFQVDREIEVIPNFICPELYEDHNSLSLEQLKKSYAPNGEKLLVHISNFRPVKRVEDVVRVFDSVRKQIPARLILVGDGPERHKIEMLCRELNTCADIIFQGKIRATEQVLRIADLFLLPSESESFGLAALEAMAAGTPVVSTNTGGLPEVNRHGYSGFLSNVGDVEDMAANAVRIIGEDATLQKFREQARSQASKFDIRNILPLYEGLYDRVAEQARLKNQPPPRLAR